MKTVKIKIRRGKIAFWNGVDRPNQIIYLSGNPSVWSFVSEQLFRVGDYLTDKEVDSLANNSCYEVSVTACLK